MARSTKQHLARTTSEKPSWGERRRRRRRRESGTTVRPKDGIGGRAASARPSAAFGVQPTGTNPGWRAVRRAPEHDHGVVRVVRVIVGRARRGRRATHPAATHTRTQGTRRRAHGPQVHRSPTDLPARQWAARWVAKTFLGHSRGRVMHSFPPLGGLGWSRAGDTVFRRGSESHRCRPRCARAPPRRRRGLRD